MDNLIKIYTKLKNLQRFDAEIVNHPTFGYSVEKDYQDDGNFVDYQEIEEILEMIKTMEKEKWSNAFSSIGND